MMYVQQPPNAVQVEASEGCNLRCTFCGIQGIREAAGGPYKLMTLDTAERVASEMRRLKWPARVEFAMHGEPTMNPLLPKILGRFRAALPGNQIMVTSNGGGLLKDPSVIDAMFTAGLNLLCLDNYEYVKIVPKVLARWRNDQRIPVFQYPQDAAAPHPHHRHPVSTRAVLVIQDISVAEKGSHATLDNHAGAAAPPLAEPLKARCAKPFRELSVRWDGSVALCCDDWRGAYKIGSVNEVDLDTLWQHPRFMAARKRLAVGDRAFGVCSGCDKKSVRVGLLPDKLGKAKMPAYSLEDAQHLLDATSGKPLTPSVPRPWEER